MGRFRKGVLETEYPQVPLMLSAKLPVNNILVGEDSVQERFAEQFLNAQVVSKPQVTDEDLLGKETPQLLRVPMSNSIELSPNLKAKTGIWSLAPLEPGTPGINALSKYAAGLVGKKSDRATLQLIADTISKSEVLDIRATIWKAAGLWIDPPPPFKPWPDPWKEPLKWVPSDADPEYRLNTLYKQLVGYVFVHNGDKEAINKLGVSPARQQFLKGMSLDLDRVYATLQVLSGWRMQRTDPLLAALKISSIWCRI